MIRPIEVDRSIPVRVLQEVRMGGGLNQITFWGIRVGDRGVKSGLFLTFNPLWRVRPYLSKFKLELGIGESVGFNEAWLVVDGGLVLDTSENRLLVATFDDSLGMYVEHAMSLLAQFDRAQLQPRLF